MKFTYRYIIAIIFLSFLGACTNLDERWYDATVPELFYKNERDIKAALYRPFTHARWYVEHDRWRLQEHTADQFAVTTKGKHWYNGGENERYHYHSWTPQDGWVWGTWRGTLMGVALALDTKQDLTQLDYAKFNLSQEVKADHVNQLNTLIAYFYLRGLDYFGGLPIFTSNEGDNIPRSTDKETFAHIESLLLEALDKLPSKVEGSNQEGALKKGAAAAMLAQLYFNAESYIGVNMFAECAKLSEAIINGEYGSYELDQDWFGPHDFYNNDSPEIIWSTPSEFNKLEYNSFANWSYHYNSGKYFGNNQGGWNGQHLTPSRKPSGELYTEFRLGKPYEKFHDLDLRKKPYQYNSNGNYEGMFLVGPQISEYGESLGGEEYRDQVLDFVDMVGRFSESNDPQQLKSSMANGEENSGIRLVKVPLPNLADESLMWAADNPIIRLAEIYYMLAECNLRLGNKAKAANLINEVRKRNFQNGLDPDPVTADNLDKYRMLDEWGTEFLGEGRRRTDLIRWNLFTTEAWWDHQPSGSDHLRRFPVPENAISGNNALEQNPGY